jgi:hypothetical protein
LNFLVFLYIFIIFILHVIPLGDGGTDRFDLGPLRADYLLHTLIFLPWMFFVVSAKSQAVSAERQAQGGKRRAVSKKRIFLGWMGLGIALAVGVEGLQYWLDYRAFNPLDAAFNVLGVVGGGIAVSVWRGARGA